MPEDPPGPDSPRPPRDPTDGLLPKWCNGCERWLPRSAFSSKGVRDRPMQVMPRCKECRRPRFDALIARRDADRAKKKAEKAEQAAQEAAARVTPASGAGSPAAGTAKPPAVRSSRPPPVTALEKAARKKETAIAHKAVELALAGDRVIMRTVLEYLYGRPKDHVEQHASPIVSIVRTSWTSDLRAMRTAFGTAPSWPMRAFLIRTTGKTPHPLQESFLRGLLPDGTEARIKLATGGEQGGKSMVTALEAWSRIFHSPLIWIVAPDYEQARNEVQYLVDFGQRTGLLQHAIVPNSPAPMRLFFSTGAVVKTLSAMDEARIAGEAPDVILMVEAGQQSVQSFQRCLGRIAPRNGYLIINGTLERSTDWFANLYRTWSVPNDAGALAMNMPSWSNTFLYKKGRQDPKIKFQEAQQTPAQFKERFEGVPTEPEGLVHKDFKPHLHVRNIHLAPRPPDADGGWDLYLPPTTAVEVWIDPGWAHYYVVLAVAISEDRVYILDEIAAQGLNARQMIALTVTRPWWGRVVRGVMDVAGSQHHGGETNRDLWQADPRDGGAGLPIAGRRVDILEGIDRVSSFLHPSPIDGLPRLWVDPKCRQLIWEWSEGYRRRVDRSGRVLDDVPIDRHNDAAKAVVYGLTYHFDTVGRHARKAVPRTAPVWEQMRRLRGRSA